VDYLRKLSSDFSNEIQNPLNFENNFSEVTRELILGLNEEIEKSDLEEVQAISADIKENLSKINRYDKQADAGA
jgi:two-component system NtrC family sensor kinase